MRVVVTGSRDGIPPTRVKHRLYRLLRERGPCEIIHGAASGVDTYAGIYGRAFGHKVVGMPADWKTHGKRAGIIRNCAMLDQRPDLVLAFWDGESRGTRHCMDEAARRGIPVEAVTA